MGPGGSHKLGGDDSADEDKGRGGSGGRGAGPGIGMFSGARAGGSRESCCCCCCRNRICCQRSLCCCWSKAFMSGAALVLGWKTIGDLALGSESEADSSEGAPLTLKSGGSSGVARMLRAKSVCLSRCTEKERTDRRMGAGRREGSVVGWDGLPEHALVHRDIRRHTEARQTHQWGCKMSDLAATSPMSPSKSSEFKASGGNFSIDHADSGPEARGQERVAAHDNRRKTYALADSALECSSSGRLTSSVEVTENRDGTTMTRFLAADETASIIFCVWDDLGSHLQGGDILQLTDGSALLVDRVADSHGAQVRHSLPRQAVSLRG